MTDFLIQPAVLTAKLEAKSKSDEAALVAALEKLVCIDPSISFSPDRESGELVLGGASELDLDRVVGELLSMGIGMNVGAPQVAYRETLAAPAEVDHTHALKNGGIRLKMRLEPSQTNSGNTFEFVSTRIADGERAAIERGVRSTWENGVLIGFPMVDTKVTLIDAHSRAIDTQRAFEAAARATMKAGCKTAGVNILEPMMQLVIVAPTELTGVVVADLDARRAQMDSTTQKGPHTQIEALAPLAALFGLASSLGSMTEGRATHRMTFSHYQAVPRNVIPDPGKFPPAVGMRA